MVDSYFLYLNMSILKCGISGLKYNLNGMKFYDWHLITCKSLFFVATGEIYHLGRYRAYT